MTGMDAYNAMTQPQTKSRHDTRSVSRQRRDRILIIDPDSTVIDQMVASLSQRESVHFETATSFQEAQHLVEENVYDLILCDGDIAFRAESNIIRTVEQSSFPTRIIVTGKRENYREAMAAIQAGAADYLIKPASTEDDIRRTWKAFDDAVRERRKDASIDRLRRICKRLNAARLDVTSQIDGLCNDLVNAYDDLAGQISLVTMITEFTAIIRQELDVEDLLRTTLEYFLRRIGPMNAAVFLPGMADEFTLGAYINYDCPKDNADFMLDQLADVIPQQMMNETRVLEFRSNAQIEAWIGDEGHWLSDSHVVAFSCCHEDECLAVFTLFRNLDMPFDDDFVPLMESVAEAFAKQLAHVIHVHHRALPIDPEDDYQGENDWPTAS